MATFPKMGSLDDFKFSPFMKRPLGLRYLGLHSIGKARTLLCEAPDAMKAVQMGAIYVYHVSDPDAGYIVGGESLSGMIARGFDFTKQCIVFGSKWAMGHDENAPTVVGPNLIAQPVAWFANHDLDVDGMRVLGVPSRAAHAMGVVGFPASGAAHPLVRLGVAEPKVGSPGVVRGWGQTRLGRSSLLMFHERWHTGTTLGGVIGEFIDPDLLASDQQSQVANAIAKVRAANSATLAEKYCMDVFFAMTADKYHVGLGGREAVYGMFGTFSNPEACLGVAGHNDSVWTRIWRAPVKLAGPMAGTQRSVTTGGLTTYLRTAPPFAEVMVDGVSFVWPGSAKVIVAAGPLPIAPETAALYVDGGSKNLSALTTVFATTTDSLVGTSISTTAGVSSLGAEVGVGIAWRDTIPATICGMAAEGLLARMAPGAFYTDDGILVRPTGVDLFASELFPARGKVSHAPTIPPAGATTTSTLISAIAGGADYTRALWAAETWRGNHSVLLHRYVEEVDEEVVRTVTPLAMGF